MGIFLWPWEPPEAPFGFLSHCTGTWHQTDTQTRITSKPFVQSPVTASGQPEEPRQYEAVLNWQTKNASAQNLTNVTKPFVSCLNVRIFYNHIHIFFLDLGFYHIERVYQFSLFLSIILMLSIVHGLFFFLTLTVFLFLSSLVSFFPFFFSDPPFFLWYKLVWKSNETQKLKQDSQLNELKRKDIKILEKVQNSAKKDFRDFQN